MVEKYNAESSGTACLHLWTGVNYFEACGLSDMYESLNKELENGFCPRAS